MKIIENVFYFMSILKLYTQNSRFLHKTCYVLINSMLSGKRSFRILVKSNKQFLLRQW